MLTPGDRNGYEVEYARQWLRTLALIFGKLRIARSRTLGWIGGPGSANRPAYISGRGPNTAITAVRIFGASTRIEYAAKASNGKSIRGCIVTNI